MIDDDLIRLGLRNRLLTASGLPTLKGWSNKDRVKPGAGTPYLEEDFVPAPTQLIGLVANGGAVQAQGLYVIKWYGAQGAGEHDIRAGVKNILAKFSSGTIIPLADGNAVRIKAQPGPWAGQVMVVGDGYVVCTVTIGYWLLTTNAVIA